ncbi:MAG: 4-hydroxy-tetrahydrodipicolinate synthase [Rickettsia endosymbiont of Bryobia graminum]|nr:4-hydroxy-tetrahydrodipicolinate synthase [Rickettsia endosymbiont of Bryobia graminum]
MNNIFTGLITALITPFKNNQLDFASLEKIVNYQIDNKVDGIVVGGSTGEGTSLTLEEYRNLLEAAVKVVDKRLPVIAGCSANSTNVAVEMIKISEDIGTDGFMCSVPPYVKPMQEGIYLHFEALHNASNLPIMLYSVPSRTIFDFTDETILRLSKLPRIVALKDAYNDLERPIRLKNMIDKEFNLLCGNDEIALSYNAQGGVGCVSVASNIAPKLCKELQESCQNNNYHKALTIQQQLSPLYKSLFLESNPIGTKYAAYKLGLCTNELRLPLTAATNNTQEKINKIISKYV